MVHLNAHDCRTVFCGCGFGGGRFLEAYGGPGGAAILQKELAEK